jgi:membrane protein HdeD
MTATSHHLKSSSASKPKFNFCFVEGALLILFGLAAVTFPEFAGVATAILLGWVLMACGIAGLFGAFAARPHLHFGWSMVSALVAIAAGLITALNPEAGSLALIVVVAAWLALDGLSSMMLALHQRRAGDSSWAWLAASAAADWLLAVLLVALAPTGGVLVVGVIVGIDLVLAGVLLLTGACVAKEA